MTEQESQELCRKIMERCATPGHFSRLLGLRCDSLTPRRAEGHLEVTEQLCNLYGIVHGGVYFTLMDELVGMAASATGRIGVTLDTSVSYLKSVKLGDTICCVTESVHVGRSVGVYDAKCWNRAGELLCTATFHLFFVRPLEEVLQ